MFVFCCCANDRTLPIVIMAQAHCVARRVDLRSSRVGATTLGDVGSVWRLTMVRAAGEKFWCFPPEPFWVFAVWRTQH